MKVKAEMSPGSGLPRTWLWVTPQLQLSGICLCAVCLFKDTNKEAGGHQRSAVQCMDARLVFHLIFEEECVSIIVRYNFELQDHSSHCFTTLGKVIWGWDLYLAEGAQWQTPLKWLSIRLGLGKVGLPTWGIPAGCQVWRCAEGRGGRSWTNIFTHFSIPKNMCLHFFSMKILHRHGTGKRTWTRVLREADMK